MFFNTLGFVYTASKLYNEDVQQHHQYFANLLGKKNVVLTEKNINTWESELKFQSSHEIVCDAHSGRSLSFN